MDYTRNRKYPRVYKKHPHKEEERSLSLSSTTAAGILAFAFIGGTALGYYVKKKWLD